MIGFYTLFEFLASKVRFYGLMYALSFLLINKLVAIKLHKYDSTKINNVMFDVILGLIVGGSLGYILAYDTENIFNFYEIMAIWKGGMAAYGGFVIGIIVLYWRTKAVSIPLKDFTDALATFLPIGLFLGRLANLVNGEIVGKYMSEHCAYRHPVSVYNMLFEGVFISCVMLWKN
ncbi:MAG: prolipoprotein diacylglyceryl transferase, partial [Romboutsia sp.]|nr:prolipoprotein diacylglyceryl transferase [Romboutsia sp.]